MPSLRARLFYQAMKVFFKFVLPSNLPLEQYRKAANQPFSEPMPRGVRWEVGQLNGVDGEWVTPEAPLENRVLLYLHGGGYVIKSPQVHRVLVGRLINVVKCRAFIADYRLAPEHPYPAALDDALAAYHGLLASGHSASKIVVAGDSAGGGLAAALLLSLRDAGQPLPAAACLMSPLLDCTFSSPNIPDLQKRDPYLRVSDLQMMVKHYCGDYDPRHALISPLFADLGGLPPLLIYAGENEVLRDDSIRFGENAERAGVKVTLKVWEGMIHAFPLFSGLIPEGKTAISDIGAFFQPHLESSSQAGV